MTPRRSLVVLSFAFAVAIAFTPPLFAGEDLVGYLIGQPDVTGTEQSGDGVFDACDLLKGYANDPGAADFEKLQVFATHWDSMAGLCPADRDTAMAAWLNSQADVLQAGVSEDGGVWVVLEDGTPALFPNNRFPSEAPPPLCGGRTAPARTVPRSGHVNGNPLQELTHLGLPNSNYAESISAFDFSWESTHVQIRLYNDLKSVGYEISPLSLALDPPLSDMRAIKNMGVLYMTGHGCTGRFQDEFGANGISGPYFALWTPSLVYSDHMARYRPEMLAKRAVPVYAGYGKSTTGTQYCRWQWGITGEFIREYWTFVPNSLFVADMCSTYNASIYDAAIAKGLDTYLGWTQTSDDVSGSRIVLQHMQRMLGIAGATTWETSPVRPFPLEDVRREMDDHDQVVDSLGAFLNEKRRNDSSFSGLAPSIRCMLMDSYADELHLYGMFGGVPDIQRVTINNQPVEILQWGFYEIVAKVPSTGPTSYGVVRVESQHRKSNKKTLARYQSNVQIDVSDADGHGLGHASGTITLRADIMPYRLKPDGKLGYTADHYYSLSATNPLDLLYLTRMSDASYMAMPATGDRESSLSYEYEGEWQEESCGTHQVSGSGSLQGSPAPLEMVPEMPDGVVFEWNYAFDETHLVPTFRVVLDTIGATGTLNRSECESLEYDFISQNLSAIGRVSPTNAYTMPGGTANSETNASTFTWTAFTVEPELGVDKQGL